jgi:hypothetical protein
MKKILVFLFFALLGNFIVAQNTPTFDDLNFESDSITKTYKATGKGFVYMKSKRGAGGAAKTSGGDSLVKLNAPINEIVLVFTEDNAADIENREAANRERWENLLATYPQLFQFETTYKNLCQCNYAGDQAAFKQAQGFYIYVKAKEEAKPVAVKTEPKKEEKKTEKEPVKEEKKEKKQKEEKVVKEEKVAKTEKKEKPKKEEKAEEVAKKEEPVEETPAAPVVKTKRPGFAKPKKAKDPKACRPPCYVGGDEGLNQFFKENVQLSKKEKRHSDELVCKLRIQLNFDGTIKKTFIMGANETLNKQVEDAAKNMDTWNACVLNGTTVKSDVTLTLKYDPETHSVKPFETMITPRPGPKCKCVEDSEMFAE